MKTTKPQFKILINAYNVKSYGIKNYTKQLIVNLLKQYPEISVCLITSNANHSFFQNIENCSLICLPSRIKVYLKFFSIQKLLRNFSIVHSVGNYGFIFCPIPQVITIHDTYEKVCPERFSLFKRIVQSFLIKNSIKNAHGIITNSKNTLNDVKKYYPIGDKKISAIYLGTQFSINGKKTKEEIIERIECGSYIFVGTLEPGKNLRLLLEAIAIQSKKNRNVSLKIIGAYGWNQKEIYTLSSKLGIESNVSFMGKINDDELIHEYKNARALVLPSNYEGFGLPVIEAMACGCPVIAANNSSIPEAGGQFALYFDNKDVNQLIEKMDFLDSHKEQVVQMVFGGYVHASNFKWEKTASETFKFYKTAALMCSNYFQETI
ncbi:MAG: glycosyltransferase family 4 protein [Bacteroidales bacterium]|nr:glycosyltransferase family 4 protein [Bacteroidales bacterium]